MNHLLFKVFPLVVKADQNVKTITIQASGHSCTGKRILDKTHQVRKIVMGGPVDPAAPEWRQPEALLPFDRLENGDLEVRLTCPAEDEYMLALEDENGTEVQRFSIYALKEDLFNLRPYKGDFHIHSCNSDGKETASYVAASCRKIGFDFMALTDHCRYEPSLEAMEAMKKMDTDMLCCPGEEVHLPGNEVHIINFGGSFSVNQFVRDNEELYRKEVAERDDMPKDLPTVTRFQVAASEWTFDKIREGNGIAMFCHPYWRPGHNYIGEDVVDLLHERNRFDVLEVFGGFYRYQVESNMLALSRYMEERSKGKKIPVAGISDAHGCDGDLFGWYYTIIFADELKFESLATSIRNEQCVAVHWIPDEHPIIAGPFRLTRFAHFLLREFYPAHDDLCRVEGEIMCRNEENAAELMKYRKGSVPAYFAQCWEK